jgi:LDH2 family malate/lactate/ureidoglycolate dehydrogenase
MPETYYIIPKEKRDTLVTKAYLKRGYDAAEAAAGARFCASAAYYGIARTTPSRRCTSTNCSAAKSAAGHPVRRSRSCLPVSPRRKVWNGHDKLGQAVAYEAMDTCLKLADKYGVGMVSVDNATHYLWRRRLRHGRRAQRLFRLHELHLGHVRSRAVRRQDADDGHRTRIPGRSPRKTRSGFQS